MTFVGDSFTTGHGIADMEDRFANRLRRAHPEWEVHLIAQNGLDTGEEIAAIRQGAANGYEFDLVVLVYCLNDLGDLMPEWSKVTAAIGGGVRNQGWLTRNSYFASVLGYRLEASRNPYMAKYFDFVKDGYRGEVWERQQARLREFQRVVEKGGGRLAVATFPFMHALGTNYEYQFVHDQLAEFWKQQNVPHLELLPAFRGLSPQSLTVNSRDPHPNAHANGIAANAMDEFIVPLLAEKQPTEQGNLSPVPK
ncbi:MAG: hypothetical protein EPO07_16615 [Verrucomicrobia bacterium]|nr:MAG: hypothetical protein EPO07_16615 [Verrucomicrobiota bacterium]